MILALTILVSLLPRPSETSVVVVCNDALLHNLVHSEATRPGRVTLDQIGGVDLRTVRRDDGSRVTGYRWQWWVLTSKAHVPTLLNGEYVVRFERQGTLYEARAPVLFTRHSGCDLEILDREILAVRHRRGLRCE